MTAPPAVVAARVVDRSRDVLPGLVVAVAIAVVARVVHELLPARIGAAIGEVVLAIGIGLIVGNVARLPAAWAAGVHFAFHRLLRAAIVLLGVRVVFGQLIAIGGQALLMIVALMTAALAGAHLAGRIAGLPGRLSTLIGVATSVCGNSAIAAAAPVIRADDREVSTAVAVNTLFGTLAVFLYPIIGHAVGMTDAVFGTWAGTAVNDTSQVVAAGFAFSPAAAEVATTVKLTRNALMGAVVIVVGLLHGNRDVSASPARRFAASVPPFVLAFVAVAALNSLGVVDGFSDILGVDLVAVGSWSSAFLLTVALAGVGLGTDLGGLRRAGWRPFAVGFGVASLVSLGSLALIAIIGPAG